MDSEVVVSSSSSPCPSTPQWNVDRPFLTGQFHQGGFFFSFLILHQFTFFIIYLCNILMQEAKLTSGFAESKPNSVDLSLESDKPVGCYNASVQVRRTYVLSAWSGIRPLATDPNAKNTESISRDHVVCEDYPGLVTITGGKWTTYRSMAEDAVNAAIKSGKLNPTNNSLTSNIRLVGGDGWDPAFFTVLAQEYVRMKVSHSGKVVPGVMDTAAAKHLSHSYGTKGEKVAFIAQNENLGKRLAHGYPYLEAEVAYCARNEYCESAVDFIARRSRLAFLDTDAAGRALPRVIELLAAEHHWDKKRQTQEFESATKFLESFKSSKNAQFHDGKHT